VSPSPAGMRGIRRYAGIPPICSLSPLVEICERRPPFSVRAGRRVSEWLRLSARPLFALVGLAYNKHVRPPRCALLAWECLRRGCALSRGPAAMLVRAFVCAADPSFALGAAKEGPAASSYTLRATRRLLRLFASLPRRLLRLLRLLRLSIMAPAAPCAFAPLRGSSG